jgi:hypothetical protein
MDRWLQIFLSPLLVIVFLPIARAQATTGAAITVSTVSHGVRLTIAIPRTAYPRRALVRVDLRVENVSNRRVFLTERCPVTNPDVEVLNALGLVVYPLPEPASFPPPKCPAPVPGEHGQPLGPHQVRVWHPYIVLFGSRVQAVASVGEFGVVSTRPVALRLIATTPPTLTLASLSHPVAVFHGSGIHRRRLHFAAAYSCDVGAGRLYSAGIDSWATTRGSRIMPEAMQECSSLRELHMLAGYPNHPVAMIDYVRK